MRRQNYKVRNEILERYSKEFDIHESELLNIGGAIFDWCYDGITNRGNTRWTKPWITMASPKKQAEYIRAGVIEYLNRDVEEDSYMMLGHKVYRPIETSAMTLLVVDIIEAEKENRNHITYNEAYRKFESEMWENFYSDD